MADPNQTPTLPSTADSTPYVPVSWMAVSAAVVTGIFVILLVILGAWALWDKKPLLIDKIFIFPVIGVVLSFAARRMIRNSEGTRTGESLASAAWWGSVVAGLSYGSYYLAIDYSVRRDAVIDVERWVNNILADDPADPTHRNLNAAFLSQLDPKRREDFRPESAPFETMFRDQYLTFKQSDIVRLAHRNRGECKLEQGGIRDWIEKPDGVECTFTGVLRCSEGLFPLLIPMKGVEAGTSAKTPGRKWVIVVPATGVIVPDKISRTPYGWLVEAIEQTATMTGKEFFYAVGNGSINYPYIYHKMIHPEIKTASWDAIDPSRSTTHAAVAGNMSVVGLLFNSKYGNFFRNEFFKLPEGREPTDEQKTQFKKGWDIMGLLPPGVRLKNSQDRSATTTITDTAIEVRLPCELALPGSDAVAARCRLVIAASDPALLAELKVLKADANPDLSTISPPEALKTRSFPQLRLIRVETDLRPIANPPRERGPQSPQPPTM